MKRGSFPIRLIGPSGRAEPWTVIVRPIPREKGYRVFGRTLWDRREIWLSSGMKSPQVIYSTLLHEILHVTAGPNGSEHFAESTEANFVRAAKQLSTHEGRS